MTYTVLFVVASALFLSYVQAGVIYASDEQTCLDLCKGCKGEAKFIDNRCECDIAGNAKEDIQCLSRMKREASDHGLDYMSCKSSSDHRSTRCLLGSKRLLGAKDIDKVANYFMKDGPVLGNIFIAPPLSKKSDCVGAKLITQPKETMKPKHADDCVGAKLIVQPKETMKPKHADDCVGAKLIVQPKETMNPKHIDVSSPKKIEPLVSSPEPQWYDLSEKSSYDCVGSTHSDTPQLEETFTYQDVSFDNCNPAIAQSIPTVAAPLNTLKVPTLTPLILQLLSRQLTQPLLGIPNAVQTMTQAPGMQELVSAPATLLNSLAHRISPEYIQMKEYLKQQVQQSIDDSNTKLGAIKEKVDKSVKDLTVGAANIAKSSSPCNLVGNPLGSPLISLLHPNLGTPASTPLSFTSPVVGTSAPASLSFGSPVVGTSAPGSLTYASPFVGAASPVSYFPITSIPSMQYMPSIQPYSGYVSHMPTYIVSMPYTPKYNNIDLSSLSNEAEAWSAPEIDEVDQNLGKSITVEEPKKICKKSVKGEFSRKVTRDVNSISETFDDDAAFKEIKNEIQSKAELKKREAEKTTEIPKIDRTTQQPIKMEKKIDFLEEQEKSKPAKEIIKGSKKYVKKIDEKKSNNIKS